MEFICECCEALTRFFGLTLENVKTTLHITVVLVTPTVVWYYYVKAKEQRELEYEEFVLDFQKHNCVVIYRNSEITGWPGFEGNYLKLSMANLEKAYEPICYFINTATDSLDIAMMMLHSNVICDAIISALNKGVKVRLILDQSKIREQALNVAMELGGADVCYYARPKKINSLFHHKYVVKDYVDGSGSVLCGSLNWTVAAFMRNYEDLIFSTNETMVTLFRNNFVNAWDLLSKFKK